MWHKYKGQSNTKVVYVILTKMGMKEDYVALDYV